MRELTKEILTYQLKLGQCRRKCSLSQFSMPQTHKGVRLSKLCLNLYSFSELNLTRNLVRYPTLNEIAVVSRRHGWRQEFSYGGLTLRTRGAKMRFSGIMNIKNICKYSFSPYDGRLACSDRGYNPLDLPWYHP